MNTKYWNSLAKGFEDRVLEIAKEDLQDVLKEEIKRVAHKTKTAADLGCGTGSLLKLLSPRFKKIYAVDYAAQLLEVAQQKHHFSNVEYRCHNLVTSKTLPFKVDVTFNFNALISPLADQRFKIARSVWRATKPKGFSIFVVPSFESVLNSFHAMIRCQTQEGDARSKVVRSLERMYQKEVISSVDKIVDIGGTPTKCFTKEEIALLLREVGYKIERIRKVEYSWSHEIDDAPSWLGDPYPWDWLVVVRR